MMNDVVVNSHHPVPFTGLYLVDSFLEMTVEWKKMNAKPTIHYDRFAGLPQLALQLEGAQEGVASLYRSHVAQSRNRTCQHNFPTLADRYVLPV